MNGSIAYSFLLGDRVGYGAWEVPCLNRDFLDLLDCHDFDETNQGNPIILPIMVKTFPHGQGFYCYVRA